MRTHSHNPKATTAARPDADDRAAQQGLSSDELQAEQADDLPEREAMTVLSVGGLGIDVPPADRLDDLLNTDISTDLSVTNELPIDELPVKVDFTHEDGYPYGPVTGPVERADPPPTWDTNPPPTDVIDPPPTGEIDPPVVSPVIGVPGPTPVADDTTLEA
jgi:hypothetical protein